MRRHLLPNEHIDAILRNPSVHTNLLVTCALEVREYRRQAGPLGVSYLDDGVPPPIPVEALAQKK